MGIEIIMKSTGSLRIHDNITYTQTGTVNSSAHQLVASHC